MVRFAIIGTGTMGKKYAQMLSQQKVTGAVLAAAVCRSEAARQWAADTLPSDVRICSDCAELYEHAQEFDAVLIVTPHKTHPQLAVQAFEAGKAVFCDKPAGISTGQAEQMSRAAVESGQLYAMMFHQRLYAKYNRIRALLESGRIGTISRVILLNSRFYRTAHYHKSGTWRSSWTGEGGGALINQGQHIIDIWQWLFGMPESIYADVEFGKYNDFLVDDEATILMKYKNHMTGVFMLTTGEAAWQERMEICGTCGKLILEDDTLTILDYSQDSIEYSGNTECNSREQLTIKETKETFESQEEPYVLMLENFVKAYQNGSALVAPGAEGRYALEIVNAAYLSAWQHREIRLPVDAEEYEKQLNLQIAKEQAIQ